MWKPVVKEPVCNSPVSAESRTSRRIRFLKSIFPIAILLVMIAGMLTVAAILRHSQSLTFDESFFLNCSLQTIHDGHLDPRICSEGVAPLPLILTYLPEFIGTSGADCPHLWSGRMDAPQLIQWPRFLNSILFGVPLILISCFWMQARRGWFPALVAAALIASSPVIVAHASLATMDISFATTGLLAMMSLGWVLRKPSGGRIFLSALLSAMALSSKYSAVFLFPAMVILLLTFQKEPAEKYPFQTVAGWKDVLWKFFLWCLLVIPICWAFHLFSFTGPLKTFPLSKTPDNSPWIQMLGRGPWALWVMEIAHQHLWRPAPVSGILFQYLHNQAGHPAFLLGNVSQFGWWYYFPLTFLFKSTPAELALFAFLIGCLFTMRRSPVQFWRELDPDLKAFLICSLIFISLILTANINLGQRYLILLYPVLILSGIDTLAGRFARQKWLFGPIVMILLGSQIGSQILNHPHQLAYFNWMSGGPKNGVNLLSDSNLDWGQGLPALKQFLDETPHGRLAIDPFGYALPRAYGIDADFINDLHKPAAQYEAFALSITQYQFGSQPGGCYSSPWLKHPDRVVGASIYLYKLDSPEKRQRFQELAACVATKRTKEKS